MATVTMDCCGMKCPQPVLKVATKMPEMNAGDVLEVSGDCPTFESDIKTWCTRMRKTLLWVRDEGSGKKRVQIQF